MKENWLKPNWETKTSIKDIKIQKLLIDHQIKAILLDVDGTLLPRKEKEIHKSVKDWVKKAQTHFYIHLLSNNPSKKRIEMISKELSLNFTYRASKPRLRKTLNIITGIKYNRENIAIIGDRILTDVLIGNRLGLFTILVKPINSNGNTCDNNYWQKAEKYISNILEVN